MEAVGGAVLGEAVSRLLDQVLTTLGNLTNAPANLEELKKLLERSQPWVEELRHFPQDQGHPAGQWFIQLHKQLDRAHDLIKVYGDVNQTFNVRNIFRSFETSKEAVELYGNIHKLLQEASAFQWASGTSIQRIQSENHVNTLKELQAMHDKLAQLMREISNLRSDMQLRSTVPELVAHGFRSSILDGSSSSLLTAPAWVVHPERVCDVPKPQVNYGGDVAADEVINHLLGGEYLKWVGLWGMGGIGKTFTASKVYHDSRIREHFSNRVCWVTVSKDQPDPIHLLKQLQYQISDSKLLSELPDEIEATKSYLKTTLQRHRVLLILDDVWQKGVLKDLDVISELTRSIVLVTTRDQEVFRSVIDLVKIIIIQPLSPEDSWELFRWWAFGDRGRAVPEDVEPVARMVAEECKGLPLALEVIGSTMADKQLLPCERRWGRLYYGNGK